MNLPHGDQQDSQQDNVGQWDLLLRNATVFDGSGGLPETQDVAVSNGKIAARGPALDGTAKKTIDASAYWLMPGLLDIHTHFDLEVEVSPALPEAVRHGTTTVVVSNCSLGLAYGNQRKDGADPLVDCFARVENVPKPVLKQVADGASWDNSKAYLEHLETLPLGANIAPMIPHSMLRIEAMGFANSVRRDPTSQELARMEQLLDMGMQEGYVGFSTDALPFHYLANDPNRRRKIPTQYGSYQELKRLTHVVRRHSRVWQATPPKDNSLQVLRNFLLSSGRLFGKRLKVTSVAALDMVTNRGLLKLAKLVSRLLNSRLLQGEFAFQALAAPFKVWSEGPITPIFEEIPELRLLNEPDLEDADSRRAVLNDPDYVRRFQKMWYRGKRGFGIARIKRALVREDYSFHRDLREMVIDTCPVPSWSGKSLQVIFARLQSFQSGRLDSVSGEERVAFEKMPDNMQCEAVFLLELFKQFDTGLYWYSLYANANQERMLDLLLDPNILPGFNDSGAHLSNMAFYDANLRGLKAACSRGMEAVALLVRRLTRDPAEFFSVKAGSIDPGDPADIILIDPKALDKYDSEASMKMHYREEFGYHQRVNRSDGVVTHVLVGGEIVWSDGEFASSAGTRKLGRVLTVETDTA